MSYSSVDDEEAVAARNAAPSQVVVVLGASSNPERYSNKAVKRLTGRGHTVIPIHPSEETIEGLAVTASLADVSGPVDTLTVYVKPSISSSVADDIVALGAKRVIFNPGTENEDLAARLEAGGAFVQEACTLVLLSTHQFWKTAKEDWANGA